jgi:hypothetical protein
MSLYLHVIGSAGNLFHVTAAANTLTHQSQCSERLCSKTPCEQRPQSVLCLLEPSHSIQCNGGELGRGLAAQSELPPGRSSSLSLQLDDYSKGLVMEITK